MATHSVTITTNTTTKVCNVTKSREHNAYIASLFASGSWDSATLTWKWSKDNGSTLYPITSAPGTAVTSTADDSFNVTLGVSDTNTPLSIYAVTSGGGGSLSIAVGAADNS